MNTDWDSSDHLLKKSRFILFNNSVLRPWPSIMDLPLVKRERLSEAARWPAGPHSVFQPGHHLPSGDLCAPLPCIKPARLYGHALRSSTLREGRCSDGCCRKGLQLLWAPQLVPCWKSSLIAYTYPTPALRFTLCDIYLPPETSICSVGLTNLISQLPPPFIHSWRF